MDIAVVVYAIGICEVSVVDSEAGAVIEGHGNGGSCGEEGHGLREALRLDVDIYHVGRRALHEAEAVVDSILCGMTKPCLTS